MRRAGRFPVLAAVACLAVLARAAHGASVSELEGTWYVLVHYRDAEAANPQAWLWEDRVWDLRVQGEALLWTDYELVNFVDVRGRFADLRSPWARRMRGAWEPNPSQQREIERGLFVNPRGARTLSLQREEDGWSAARREAARPELGLSLRRSGSIERGGAGLPVFRVDESLQAPGEVQRLREAVFRARAHHEDSGFEGEYAQGSRRGRFRMQPTQLRERVRPEIRRQGSRLVLKPDSIAQWENLLPALVRPWHYFGERVVEVDSLPPGAFLEVSYLRDGAQRLFEEARAPVTLVLPSRFVSGPDDVVQLDVSAPGHRPTRAWIELHGEEGSATVELEPARHRVEEAWLRVLGGGTSLVLFSEGALDIQVGQAPGRLTLVLNDTTAGPDATALLDSLETPQVASSHLLQLRESLVLRLELRDPDGPEPRFLRSALHGREGHRTEIRLPATRAAPPLPDPPRPNPLEAGAHRCASAFERALREPLDDAALTRALTLPDPRVEARLEEALRRLAAADPEARVRLTDGSALDVARPVAMAMAVSRAAEVPGLLAALRATLEDREPAPREALRSMVAPDLSPDAFAPLLAEAERAEARCRAEA